MELQNSFVIRRGNACARDRRKLTVPGKKPPPKDTGVTLAEGYARSPASSPPGMTKGPRSSYQKHEK